jgi:hypothetical protein
MDAVQYVVVDVPLCHSGDLIQYYTKHKHTDGPPHIRDDVHFEDSVRRERERKVKTTNIKFHENLSVGNLVIPHRKRNESICPF